jgi:hypothetical protein
MTHLDIIQSFSQGEVKLPDARGSLGNCASIALIKAGIEVFGVGNLFALRTNANEYQVTYKNGRPVHFTRAELERSNYVGDFRLNTAMPDKLALYQEITTYAQIALCAIVKTVTEIGESGSGRGDFETALLAVNDGANTPGLPEKLGLEDHCLPRKWFRNADGPGLVGWLNGHTVYISHSVRDDYGSVSSDLMRFPKRMQLVPDRIR